MAKIPKVIPINHDDYHAEHIGRTADGRQFFITRPFIPGKREFLALYLFDLKGQLLEAIIHDLGRREEVDEEAARQLYQQLLDSLGKVKFRRIKIAPFQIERFGVTFGLIPDEPEEGEEVHYVIMQPGDVMAFYPPWDGDYDT